MKSKNLSKTLESLYKGQVSEEKALKAIRKATPLELSRAEQNLLERGVLSEEELKEFCKIHLKAVEDKIKKIKSKLDDDHPVHILITEHESIKGFLEKLEHLRDSIKKGLSKKEEKKLRQLARNLVEAEKHHEREEETIFPRLENIGVTGPPRVMKLDHEKFKPKKKRLLKLSKHPEENKKEILDLVDFLLFNLRDHIFKEDNILYPSALQKLQDWREIKEEGDKIEYCDFTPIKSERTER